LRQHAMHIAIRLRFIIAEIDCRRGTAKSTDFTGRCNYGFVAGTATLEAVLTTS
jgi:hypothetical protein